MDSSGWDFVIVGLVGGLLGLSELLSRYRDEPARALLNMPAVLYIGINAFAAAIALWLMNIWEPDFGFDVKTEADQIKVTWILVSGLGAMAFFRSSFFIFRVGDKDVPLGPSLVMQVLLDVTDRAVDRGRAEPRAIFVSDVMKGIDFDQASLALPSYCFALMQNVTHEEQSTVANQVNALKPSTMPSEVKARLLGLVLLNIVGEDVLKAAVNTLRPHMTGQPQPPPPGQQPPAPQPPAPQPVRAQSLTQHKPRVARTKPRPARRKAPAIPKGSNGG